LRGKFRGEPTVSAYQLELCVAGSSSRTQRAINNLRAICDRELDGRYALEIIDVVQNPQAAEDRKVLATPTLIRQSPSPPRRVIGDMSDSESVRHVLAVLPDAGSSQPITRK
jgi:circadian clock protein KaiB